MVPITGKIAVNRVPAILPLTACMAMHSLPYQ